MRLNRQSFLIGEEYFFVQPHDNSIWSAYYSLAEHHQERERAGNIFRTMEQAEEYQSFCAEMQMLRKVGVPCVQGS